MRVFVLTTGRSGSTTFARACAHSENFSVGHESRWQLLGPARLDYADQHIEIDNRLCWLLGRLDARFGDDAFYVHLWRDRQAVAESYCRRRFGRGSIIRAYSQGILYRSQTDLADCLDYCDTVNANIRHFLRDKTRALTVDLAQAEADFVRFWEAIGARGDLEAALQEWQTLYNAQHTELGDKHRFWHAYEKMKRVGRQLPEFLRNA